MKNVDLTDSQKLDKVRKIIDKNLFSIFTAFTLDLDVPCLDNKLESYVELKELLDIDAGINRQTAIEYDNFKKLNQKEYEALLRKLGDRIIEIKTSKPSPRSTCNIPSLMFMTAIYLTYVGNLSTKMSFHEYNQLLQGIDEYQFTSG